MVILLQQQAHPVAGDPNGLHEGPVRHLFFEAITLGMADLLQRPAKKAMRPRVGLRTARLALAPEEFGLAGGVERREAKRAH